MLLDPMVKRSSGTKVLKYAINFHHHLFSKTFHHQSWSQKYC